MMRKLKWLLPLLLLTAVGLHAQAQTCVTSNSATWTGTAFAKQVTQFVLGPFTIQPASTPAAGSGGPVMAVSQNDLNGLTGNQYPNAAALIRQSDNGFWELYNGTTNAYSHDTAVKWVVNTPATFTWSFNIVTKTSTVKITQTGTPCSTGCTLATNYLFRATAPFASLGFWNLDANTLPLMACGVSVQMPNPVISSVAPSSGALGTLVTVTGSNFGASQGTSTVSVGGVNATTVSAWNATAITFTVPNTATTGNVIVTVSNLISNGVQFTVTTGTNPTPPVVTSVQESVTLSLSFGTSQPPPVQHSVVLSWTASTSTGVTGYNVYRSTTSGSGYIKIGSVTTNMNYTDSTVTSGTTLYYVVTAVAGANESTWSNQAAASIP